MVGLIVLLVFKVCSSIDVEAIAGSTTTLTCPFQGLSFEWYKSVNYVWSTLQKGAKYRNVNTASLIIYNVDPSDDGYYLCRVGSQQIDIQVTVIVNRNWGSWGSWTPCKKTCVGATRTRYRSCNNPTPVNGGYPCPGMGSETVSCSTTIVCTVNGNWGWWGSWTQCTKTCFGATRTRHRSCTNPTPVNGGSPCPGMRSETVACSTTIACTVNGNWGSWVSWTQCTKTCVGGTRTRNRHCNNPTPANGGSPCPGLRYERVSCSTAILCTVNGNWGWWGSWTQCTKTCFGATRTRHRSCTNPTPVNGGSPCPGMRSETVACSTTIACTVNGNWGSWVSWTQCTKTCVGGTRTRNRHCNNPTPANGGSPCPGLRYERVSCSTAILCTVNGNWGSWVSWTQCTKTCVGGTRTRNRQCNNPTPANGGSPCPGLRYERVSCSTAILCTVNGNWGSWVSWTQCTKTCVGGTRTRNRHCNNPTPANGGSPCPGLRYERVSCSTAILCTVNGNWVSWGSWTPCTKTCIGGTRTRIRTCDNPSPVNGGSPCLGLYNETGSCSTTISCAVNGNWGTWEDWNSCSVTCGSGSRSRYQECNNPEPAHGGSNCQGNGSEIDSCSIKLCLEELTSSTYAGLIVGGVSAILLLLVVIVIALVFAKRRRQTPHVTETTEVINNTLYNNEEDVTFRTVEGVFESLNMEAEEYNKIFNFLNDGSFSKESREDQMYINFSILNRTSSTDTDDDIIPTSSKINMSPNETMTYENITDINSCVNVDDLKGYIGRKQINEGLKEEYQGIQHGAQHPTTKSQLKENVLKNRYRTTLPYDHSRVIIETDHGSEKSDYINANYIDGFEKDKCYIASQGPTEITIPEHWKMIWQNNVKKIVMLTNLEESGKAKCDRYWPVGGKPMTHGSLVLTLVTEKERAAYVTREISVMNKKTKEKRVVTQHHFTAWPDHGTPDPLYLVLFHRHVTTNHNPTESSPLLVHCSAGIGRTGTYIALDALLEEGRSTGYVNIAKFLKKMRYSRMNMIQTSHQYVCLHYALLESLTMKDTSIRKDKFNEVWRNIQSDKRPINQQRINEEFKMLEAKKSEHESPEYIAAMSTENINKNRDRKSVAKDSTRMCLITFEKGRSNFINAVQVPSYTQFVGYLATQLPLPDTKVDFWTMIRDHSSSTIVLILNDQKEADLVYTATTDSFTCGQFTMKITKRDQEELDITEATLIMSKKDDKPKEIAIYQTVCEKMPDPKVLCRLVDLISTRISMSSDPVTVVSSDGAKNCGLFCTFTNAVSSMKIDETADIFQLVRLLQLRRPEFFADFKEYRLCYEAVNIYIESSNVYANF